MNYKYLPIIPLLMFNSAFAQETSSLAATDNPINIFSQEYTLPDNSTMGVAELTSPVLYSAPDAYSRGGRSSTRFGQLEFGYVSFGSHRDSIDGSGSGFAAKIEFGRKFLMPTRFASRYNFFALSLFYSAFTPKETYTASGVDKSAKYPFSVIGLPISYSSVNNERNLGYYWQIGANINYIVRIKPEKDALISGFKKMYFEPNLSIGASLRYLLNGHDMCALLGPYIGYAVSNIAKQSDAEIKIMTVGIRFTSIVY